MAITEEIKASFLQTTAAIMKITYPGLAIDFILVYVSAGCLDGLNVSSSILGEPLGDTFQLDFGYGGVSVTTSGRNRLLVVINTLGRPSGISHGVLSYVDST